MRMSERLTRIELLSAAKEFDDQINALLAAVETWPVQASKPYEPDFVMLPPPKFLAEPEPRKPVNYRRYVTAGSAFAVSFMCFFCSVAIALSLVKPS